MTQQSASISTAQETDANIPELTRSAILVGVILGIVFGASSLYLALRVA